MIDYQDEDDDDAEEDKEEEEDEDGLEWIEDQVDSEEGVDGAEPGKMDSGQT